MICKMRSIARPSSSGCRFINQAVWLVTKDFSGKTICF
jgi:hypothetical protein